MKKLITIFTLALCLIFTTSTHAALEMRTTATETVVTPQSKETAISMADIKTLSIKEIEAKVGHKLTWKQRLGLKLAKNKLKRERGDTEGSIGIGFLLGFFAGAIGVLIAYLAFKEEKKTIKGAWYGLLASVALSLIIILIVLAAAP